VVGYVTDRAPHAPAVGGRVGLVLPSLFALAQEVNCEQGTSRFWNYGDDQTPITSGHIITHELRGAAVTRLADDLSSDLI
jgi:hypothetical protein